ncbi:hypothetical protein BN1723_018676, partial [Verticillium longisporum]
PASKYAPNDRAELLKRLATFQEITDWTPKPDLVNEIEWAKRGARKEIVADLLPDEPRFARQTRLIEAALALHNDTICNGRCTMLNTHDVSKLNHFNLDGRINSVAKTILLNEDGGAGAQLAKHLNSVAGFGLAVCLD